MSDKVILFNLDIVPKFILTPQLGIVEGFLTEDSVP